MDVARLDRGLQIAGAAGLVLLISLFLPWYGVDASFGGVSVSDSASAWEAFSYTDIILFLVGVIAAGGAVAVATGNLPALPIPLGQLVLGAGALAVLLVLFRLIDIPGGDVDVAGVDLGRKLGIFVGLIAAAGVAYGGSQIRAVPTAAPLA